MQFCHGGRAIVFWSVGLRESLLVTVVMFSCSFVFVEFWSRLFFLVFLSLHCMALLSVVSRCCQTCCSQNISPSMKAKTRKQRLFPRRHHELQANSPYSSSPPPQTHPRLSALRLVGVDPSSPTDFVHVFFVPSERIRISMG